MKVKPAIVVVTYNRINSLKRLLKSIGTAYYVDNDIPLIISIDYSKINDKIVRVAEEFQWKYGKKYVIQHEENLGLRKHILECGNYSKEYGAVIILEDDLVVAPNFYEFASKAQQYYRDDDRIAGIALYSHEWNGYVRKSFNPIVKDGDIYFGQFGVSWGQCWSEKQWNEFKMWYDNHPILELQDNMPENIYSWSDKSWGKYFIYYIIEKNKFYVLPYVALSTCFSEAGEHATNISLDNQVRLNYGIQEYRFIPFEEGMHYDIFFENIELKQELSKYTSGNKNICINLYSKRKNVSMKYEYILTMDKINAEIIKGFGIEMRPIEMNIFYDIEGRDILLYKLKGEHRIRNRKINFKRLNFEAKGMPWQDAFVYAVLRALEGFKMLLGI